MSARVKHSFNTYTGFTKGAHRGSGQGREANENKERIHCQDLTCDGQLTSQPGAAVNLLSGTNTTAAVGDAGTAAIQYATPQLIRIPFGPATPDANDDIIVADPALLPTVRLGGNFTIVDFWAHVDTIEGAPLTATLHDQPLGAGAISSALDLNDGVNTLQRANSIVTRGYLVDVVGAPPTNPTDTLYVHFDANPTTAVGEFYILAFRN